MGMDRTDPLVTERAERRLAAILAVDVAGYSRLTGIDEESGQPVTVAYDCDQP